MDAASVAWVLTATALVLLMFPGVAMLYGGMLNGRSVINMMMMVMSSLAVTTVVYVIVGHGLVMGESVGGHGLIGAPGEFSFFSDLVTDDGEGTTINGAFFILFAAISVALASSGAAGRMKFDAWMGFAAIWVLVVYGPIAHWVFNPEGWMRADLQLHDYAGGTAVHMNAGAAGLALALFLGRRNFTKKEKPHNLPLMLIGVGMIAMGWLGFNGGTAGAADFLAQYVVLTTILALAGGMLGFIIMQRIIDGAYTLLGLGTGAIAGMVAITPVADAVNPTVAIIVGMLGAAGAFGAIKLAHRFGVDDSADVFAVHGVAGMVGAMIVVFLGDPEAPAEHAGIFFGGGWDMLWREPVAIIVTVGYSFCATYVIAWLMNKVHPIRITARDESVGIDAAVHDEAAYDRYNLDQNEADSDFADSEITGEADRQLK
ncbi:MULTISPECIES: ammonium transporter [Corynebacterium]|jgi:Amt family ammonium transporter|uniref:Ammonium transporter n=1 Tax=Corynebacterium provencense TaxID=1737425 RepID=A0A2Z3YVD1_9CORY|nr:MULTISPECIES: ammonium transporter [Corynebacterium]AWT26564.1 Ammonia channel [Corynebacterium provencense]MCI1257137.1 ammonium transporter [Corynebacterium provencense]